jgi:hypothetical protein
VAFGPDTPSSSQSRLDAQRSALFSAHNSYGQPFSPRRPTVLQEGYLDDQRKDHQRARSCETNRDVKWIGKARCSIRSGAGAPSGATRSRGWRRRTRSLRAGLLALEGWRAEKDNLFIRYRHRRGRLGPQTLRKRWHSTTTSSSSITSPPGEDRAPPGPPPSPVAWRGRHRNQIA